MMAKKIGKKYLNVIYLLKKKWMINYLPLLPQTTFFKTETWQTTPFANNAGSAAAHNVHSAKSRTDKVYKISVLKNKCYFHFIFVVLS